MAQVSRLSPSTVVAAAFLALLSACGGGGKRADPVPAPDRSYVRLQSEVGDYVGGGATFEYTRADAQIALNAVGGHLALNVAGDQSWTGDFVLPSRLTRLEPGTFAGLTRYPFHDPATGGLSWWGAGRGCNNVTGTIVIESAVYESGALVALDLRFEQHCEGQAPALRGQVHWLASDATAPPGPAAPPASLWRAPAGATPAAGNYVYLQSDSQDYVGGGQTWLHTPADSILALTSSGAHLGVTVTGDRALSGDFQTMTGLARIEPGFYANLRGYPFHNPVRGGLYWSADGRGCSSLTGWVAVDSATYSGGVLTAVELRFEQHCQGAGPALRGQLRWSASDSTPPPGPVSPPPGGLWAPPAGATPASGNYVYLASEAGDYVGAGRSYLYTQADALLSIAVQGGHLGVGVTGDQYWTGDFQAMASLGQLQPGYYGTLKRYPFHNPVRGGLSWSGDGRGCNTLAGWFVVDAVTYAGGTLTSIDLRFEQHCEGGAPALHGQIHWAQGDTTAPPGPVSPPPAGLWAPAAGATPASGNYVYLASDPGDYVGAGRTLTYTQATAILTVTSSGGNLSVNVEGDQYWNGLFRAMSSLSRLEPGYYANLHSYSPVRGGLSWWGDGRSCNTLGGWFVVDAVTYSGDLLTSLDLRFEQRCEGGAPALHGQIHWDTSDTTAPVGPVSPPPAGLWAAASGATPASGNYVYLASDPADYVGAGRTWLYIQANAILEVSGSGGYLSVRVNGDQWWYGDFQAMVSLARLEPGYYGNLQRYPFHNRVRGGLSWSGDGRGCNALGGWFVVDAVTYAGGALTSVDLRFEQHCEGGVPALHGQIHWDASDTTAPPGPVNPPPAGLWAPPAGATPSSGSYVYLASDFGDYIGAGQTTTHPGSEMTVSGSGGHLAVYVNGTSYWYGDFQAMAGLGQLQPGYYGDLIRYPFHNPTRGGLSWWGNGRGCNTLTGWFVVDAVNYAGDTLTAIDLRFEQHCEGAGPALRGQIHWTAP